MDIDAAIDAVRTEWNKAEGAIKLAEQVNSEIVNPAIYELRYAGRRIIEALSTTEEGKAKELLADAHFDCCRARHDAIDAATSKMSADLDIAMTKLGAEIVLKHHPQVAEFIESLGSVRDRIVISREQRDNRDAIYASIEAEDLGQLVKRYRTFKASEPLMKAAAKRARTEALGGKIVAVLGLIIAIAALGFAYYTWQNPVQTPVEVAAEQG